jgi:hypothetical protein
MASPDAGSVDLPIQTFGGRVTQYGPQSLPVGASPFNQDVSFSDVDAAGEPIVGGVASRPGMGTGFYAAPFAGNPSVNYLKTFIDLADIFHLLSLDSLGNVRDESPCPTVPGVPTIIGTVLANCIAQSDSLLGREWLAISNSAHIGFGLDIPRQWNGQFFDRVSQVGPGAGPVVTNFLPPPATVEGTGAGGAVNIVAAPNGALTTDRITFTINLPPPRGGHQITSYFTTATITTTAPHGFVVGQVVNIAGVTNPLFNVVGATITAVPSPTTFKYALFSSVLVQSGGGTATPIAPSLNLMGNVVLAETLAPHGFQQGWSVVIGGFAGTAVGGAIVSATQQDDVITITTTNPHGLSPGTEVIVAGVTDTSYNTPNGIAVASTPTPTTYTYILPNGTATVASSGGTTTVPWNGTYSILSTPTPSSFTYAQVAPNNQTNAIGTATIVGNVTPGTHLVSVAYITREQYITKPSPPTTFVANGGQLLQLTQIATTSYPNIIGRILMFTPAIIAPATSGPFFYFDGPVPTPTAGTFGSMVINDNTTTSIIIDFADAVLENAVSATNLFNLLELGECSTFAAYNERLFACGERNKVTNFVNLPFEGGFTPAGVPLGWTADPNNGAGGNSAIAQGQTPYYGDAYAIQGDGVTAIRGLITQSAFQDYLGVPIIDTGTAYSVRFRASFGTTGNATQGNLVVEIFSPTMGSLGLVTVSFNQLKATYQEFTQPLIASQVAIPQDLQLRVYTNGTVSNGKFFLIDNIEPFPTLQPYINTTVRASYALDPESFDQETGAQIVGADDGYPVRSMFNLLDGKLYYVKELGLYATQDDGQNEPDLWPIVEISSTMGTGSCRGVGIGESWAIIAHKTGAYIFWGSEPVKISQEIQPDWDTINWNADQTIYVQVDTKNKRIHIGAPVGNAVTPNVEFVLDYAQLANAEGSVSAQDIASHPQAYYSVYNPTKVVAPGKARKWTIWNISMNCATLAIRSDGSYHFLRGNGTGTGKVYDQLPSQTSDDGVAINSMYQTAFLPQIEDEQALQLGSHRKLFKYLTGYVTGSGQLNRFMYGPQGMRGLQLVPLPLQNPAPWDFESNTNWVGERVSYLWGTNAPTSWWHVTKWCPVLQRELITPVRGVA